MSVIYLSGITVYLHFNKSVVLFLFTIFLVACGGGLKKERVQVEITSFLGDNQSFVAGDAMQFLINLSVDSHLYLFYENAGGQVTQLIPSVIQPQAKSAKGDFVSFPPESGGFDLEVSAPFGEEKLWIAACQKSVELPFNRSKDSLPVISLSLAQVKRALLQLAKQERIACSYDELIFVSQAN